MNKCKTSLLFITMICIIVAALSVLGFTGCANISLDGLKEPVNMPDQYFITYTVEHTDGIVEKITKGKDSEGKVYYADTEQELLFVPQNGNYLLYRADSEGNFDAANTTQYTQKYIDDNTKKFMQCAEKSSVQYSGSAVFKGDVTLFDRPCKSYEIAITIINFSQTFKFISDVSTNICLDWKDASVVSGHEKSNDEENFTCIAFTTDNIVLPKIKK